jgi:Domain of unknown function (DUF4864)
MFRSLVFSSAIIGFVLPAHAQDAADKAAITGMIASQIEAFKRDDGATAFTFAAPIIKQQFQSDTAFLEMVKRGYQPVYRPRDYSFTELKETNLGLTQSVRITDSMGEVWNALYRVEKQEDGNWKISGVWLFKLPQVGT